jgi:hypothetical protein
MRKRVYLAGPMSGGSRIENFTSGLQAYHVLLKKGYAPICPQITFLVANILNDVTYEEWMEVDFSWVSACDAVLRLPGHSPGADREVALAIQLGIPVYHSIGDLFEEMVDAA